MKHRITWIGSEPGDIFFLGCKKITLLFLFLLLGMTGCTTISSQSSSISSANIPWKTREAALNRITSWQISGKIAVQTPQDSGTATVNWLQNPNQYQISLMGPLGSGGFKLYGQKGYVTLVMADGKTYHATNAQQLLAKQWGYNLPVTNLNYWIRGLPSPDSPYNAQFDAYHRLSSLTQQNWRVQFLGYQRVGSIELPNKIFIYSSSLNVKIIIYQWQVR